VTLRFFGARGRILPLPLCFIPNPKDYVFRDQPRAHDSTTYSGLFCSGTRATHTHTRYLVHCSSLVRGGHVDLSFRGRKERMGGGGEAGEERLFGNGGAKLEEEAPQMRLKKFPPRSCSRERLAVCSFLFVRWTYVV